MTTREDLRTMIRQRLGDENPAAYTWSDGQLNQWINDAIAIYSANFPLRGSAWLHGATGSHEYSLPDGARTVLSVEYPVGETPARYLYRLPRTWPGFLSSAQLYDILWKGDDSTADLLVVSDEIATGEHIAVEYTQDHALFADDETDTTVPDRHLELLVLFVRVCAYQERAAKEAANPTRDTLILSTLELNVSRAEREYKARLDQLKAAAAESGRAQWRMDKNDRVY